jgi:hypothetical protein
MIRALFICTQNRLRSPTAEQVFPHGLALKRILPDLVMMQAFRFLLSKLSGQQ